MSVLVAVNAVICRDMLWCTAAHPPELRDKAVSRNVLFQRKEAYVGRMPRSTMINIMLPKVQPTSHAFHRMSTGQMRIAALRLWSCRWQYCKSLLQGVMYATDINFHEFPYGYAWYCMIMYCQLDVSNIGFPWVPWNHSIRSGSTSRSHRLVTVEGLTRM